LAAVFAVAGLTKAADPRTFRRTLTGFGLSDALAAPLSVGLPALEVLAAAALLSASLAWWGAVTALGLLLAFATAIAVNLARGSAPDCNCFGQLHSTPLSWSMFARNIALSALAAVIVLQGRDAAGPGFIDRLASPAVVEIAGLSLGLLVLGWLASVGRSLQRVEQQQAAMSKKLDALFLDGGAFEGTSEPDAAPVEREDAAPPAPGLPIGAPAPAFSLPDLHGAIVSLEGLRARGVPVLLVFVSPTCGPCKSLLPIIHVWERDYDDRLTVVLVSRGTREENQERLAPFGSRHLLVQPDASVSDDYQAQWTPAAVLVGDDGKIATQVATGNASIRAMVTHAIATGVGRAGGVDGGVAAAEVTVGASRFKVGEPAPVFTLPDVDGRETSTRDLFGREALLLFWDPDCRFCDGMLADLKAWEAAAASDAPRLAIIASGDIDAIRAQRAQLRSLLLVDQTFDVAPLFGAQTTPSAVLLDRQGRIGSSLAIGARNVLALVGIRQRVATAS
jgi:methylamine dehydrogenase accessory protein MauD